MFAVIKSNKIEAVIQEGEFFVVDVIKEMIDEDDPEAEPIEVETKDFIEVRDGATYDGLSFKRIVFPEIPEGMMVTNTTYKIVGGVPKATYDFAKVIPFSVSRRQFYTQLAFDNIISQEDAIKAASSGFIPAPLEAIIDQLPNDEAKFNARMMIISAQSFEYLHELSNFVVQALNWTQEQKEDFFINASKR